MCKLCGQRFCPPSCPSYEGVSAERGRPLGRCAECGEHVYKNDLYYIENKKIFCADCAFDM